ncbi:MAG: hypothetical protein Q8920_07090 [Bacillota bacterium]|nr:hypothetical protein [Bacillota bacterium]
MEETINSSEVPYLEEIQRYMPIDPIDEEDINKYIDNIVNLICVNFKYTQYQFAYFGAHLLYMTYIYCSVWKISRFSPERYTDSILFARAYSGKEKKIDFLNIRSIFQYSNVPEKDMAKFFSIVCLDDAQIKNIQSMVDKRNDLAHASGRFELLTEEQFKSDMNAIYSSFKNIHRCMDKQIRQWFGDMIVQYAKGGFDEDYSEVSDVVYEEMIQNYNLSINELLICNEASITEYVRNYKEYGLAQEQVPRLQKLKDAIRSFCDDQGYLYEDIQT